MKRYKRSTAVVVVSTVLLVCMISGCVNSWTIIGSYDIGGDAAPGRQTFSPGGTFTWSQPSLDISGKGKWTLVANHLTITFSGGNVQEGDIQGNPLSFSTYGDLDQYENGVYVGPGMGTTTYERRFLGWLDALAAMSGGADKLTTTDAGGPGARDN